MVEQEITQNQDVQELSQEIAQATDESSRRDLLSRLTAILIKTSYQKGQTDGYNNGFRMGSSLLNDF